MAGEWSIEGEARRLFNEAFMEGARRNEAMGVTAITAIEAGIRAGLLQAIAVSREPDMLYVHELRWRLCERYGLPKK